MTLYTPGVVKVYVAEAVPEPFVSVTRRADLDGVELEVRALARLWCRLKLCVSWVP